MFRDIEDCNGDGHAYMIQFDHVNGKPLKKEHFRLRCPNPVRLIFQIRYLKLHKFSKIPISTKKRKASVVCLLIDIRVRTISYKYALK